jgi:ABC-type amino acid transport substrate-binding protein
VDRLRHLIQEFGGFALIIGLLLMVGLLPPDTSLSEIRKIGTLKACVPTTYPPLVTGDPAKPGVDIEILTALAGQIGVDLQITHNDAIGRDFNPRNWAITRANCQVLAGGVVDSLMTRSFLDTGPPYAVSGWAILAPKPVAQIDGLTIGALTAISGLNRIDLSKYLGSHGVKVRVVPNSHALVDGIVGGTLDAGVTEALMAGGIAAQNGWWTAPMPNELTRYNLVFGLWKGDLTLKRKVDEAFLRLQSDGTLAAILQSYGVAAWGQGGTAPAL